MKKLSCVIMLCASVFSFAQNSTSKIPSDAAVVATIKGNNLLQLMSIDELNNSFMGTEILKELSRKQTKYNSLEDFGFDLNGAAHYFFQANDSINYNAFIVPLKNVTAFESFLTTQSKKEIANVNGIRSFKDHNQGGIVWDSSNLIMVVGSTNDAYFQNPEVMERYGLTQDDYYGYVIDDAVVESAEDYDDEVIEAEEAYEEEIEETVIESTESEEVYEDEYMEEEATEVVEYDYNNDASNYQIKSAINKNWALLKAEQLLKQQPNRSILKNKSYLSSLDSKAEATLWVNDFGQLYANMLGSMYYNQLVGFDLSSMYANNGLTAKLFLENDKMVLNTKYTMSDQMADSYKKMTSRKLNKKFLDYVNEDRMIGFMSYSIDTEAMLEEYPKLMKSIYSNMPYYGEEASLGIDLFSLLLDEEAVGEVINGDLLFLLSGISQQEVTYTTYQYNDDYEYVEVEKTKTETVPDFLLMASTDEPSMLNKLIQYTVNKEMVTFNNGYYTFEIPRSPLAIHFVIKDGIAFLGTSEAEMNKIVSGTFDAKVTSKTKKMMLDNSYSVFVSAKQLAQQLPIEEMGIDRSGKLEWFLNTTEDAYITASKIKGNAVNSEMVVGVPPTEENALKYIFNIIEKFAK